jgi:hypothetical protein
MHNRINKNFPLNTTNQSPFDNAAVRLEIHRTALRVNQVKAQLSQESGEEALYSDAIKKMGLKEMLTSEYIEIWKRILGACINIEIEERFSQLQKSLAREDPPFCEIIIDARCTNLHD